MSEDGFKLKPWLRFLGLLLLIFFLYSIASFMVREASSGSPQGRIFTSDKSSDSVVARIRVEPQASVPRGQFRSWISLENLTSEPVHGLRFTTVRRFHSEENRRTDVGEITAGVNADLVRSFPQRPGVTAGNSSLAPGDRHTFWTTFQAPEADGEYELLLLFEWRQGRELVQNSVLVGPLEVPGMKAALLRAGNSMYVIWKDLALPLVLVALTFLFSQWGDHVADRRKKDEQEAVDRRKEEEDRREQARREAEREKERESRELERHTEQIRETLARMLIVSRRDTQRFYLPLLASSSLLTARMKKDRAGWKQEAFFHLMAFLRVMQRLKEENGGLYLKSRRGEKVIAGAWWLFKPAAEERFGPEKYAAAVEEMGPRENYASFVSELPSRKALQLCQTKFERWLEPEIEEGIPFAQYVPALQLFYEALKYEVDRPLVYWYGEADPPPKEEMTLVKEQLLTGSLGEKVRAAELDKEIDGYLAELEAEYQRFNAKMRRIRGEGGS